MSAAWWTRSTTCPTCSSRSATRPRAPRKAGPGSTTCSPSSSGTTRCGAASAIRSASRPPPHGSATRQASTTGSPGAMPIGSARPARPIERSAAGLRRQGQHRGHRPPLGHRRAKRGLGVADLHPRPQRALHGLAPRPGPRRALRAVRRRQPARANGGGGGGGAGRHPADPRRFRDGRPARDEKPRGAFFHPLRAGGPGGRRFRRLRAGRRRLHARPVRGRRREPARGLGGWTWRQARWSRALRWRAATPRRFAPPFAGKARAPWCCARRGGHHHATATARMSAAPQHPSPASGVASA